VVMTDARGFRFNPTPVDAAELARFAEVMKCKN